MRAGFTDRTSGTRSQRGSGAYTLCDRCNSNTGAWYWQLFRRVVLSGDGNPHALPRKSPTLIYMNYLFPLANLKQIVAMFFSVNNPPFREAPWYLERLLLDRERKYLPPHLRVFGRLGPYISHRGAWRLHSALAGRQVVRPRASRLRTVPYRNGGRS